MRSLALVLLAACSDPASKPDAPPPEPWTRGPDLPTPRLEPGVTALGQRLVVVGGFDSDVAAGLDITNSAIVLDPNAPDPAWKDLPAAPVQWTHINLAGVGATVYMLGGTETAQFTPRGEAYALDTDAPMPHWRQLASLPAGQERGASGIVVVPPHILLLGGATATTALATCLDYDLSMDKWTMLPDLPAPRSHPAAMRMVDGTLIVAGGLATVDAASAVADVWALPPGASAWVPRAPMPTTPRGGCAYGVVEGQLICAGGEMGTSALMVTERYDPVTDVWSVLPGMPDARAGTQGAVIANRLYVPGGARQLIFEPEASLFVFSLVDVK